MLFLLADFSKGGISRYHANLLPHLRDVCHPLVAVHTIHPEHTDWDLVDTFNSQGMWVHCTAEPGDSPSPKLRYVSVEDLLPAADLVTTAADHPAILTRHDWQERPLLVQLHSTCSVTRQIVQHSDPYANAYIVTSQESLTNAAERWHVPRERLHLVELVVDRQRLQTSASRETLRRAFLAAASGTTQLRDPGQPWVLYYGRFAPEKRLELIADAVRRLGWVGVFAGDGWMHAQLAAEIRRRAPHNHLLLPWGFSPGELLKACDVFVCASDFEGGPTTSIEALLAGVPIASTDVGILQSVPGSYASAGKNPDVTTLADAIRRAVDLPDRWPLAAEHAWRFSPERQAEQWRTLLQTDWSQVPLLRNRTQPPAPTLPTVPCQHRGPQVETRLCDLCGSKGQPFAVYQCQVHGECTIGRKHSAVRSCLTCGDRTA